VVTCSPLERQVRQPGLAVHEHPQVDVHQLLQNLGVRGHRGQGEEEEEEEKCLDEMTAVMFLERST